MKRPEGMLSVAATAEALERFPFLRNRKRALAYFANAFSTATRKFTSPENALAMPISDPRDIGGPRQPMLIAQRLTKHFPLGGGRPGKRAVVQAIDAVSFDVRKG